MNAPKRKLLDILSTHPSAQREQAKYPPFANNSFQNVPMETCPAPTNPSNLAPGSFPYKNFPQTQNLFYHPMMKSNNSSFPSPLTQLAALQNQRDRHPLYFAQQSQVELENQANFYGSSINSEFLNSLNVMEGSKVSMLTQPKNLGELLQKSFLSTHSTTFLQSPFVSANQSPYVGYNLLNGSCTQAPLNPDYSTLLTASVLGTPLQAPQVLRNQNVGPQVSENSNEKLLFQIEGLLKQENGRDIKMALAELIHQYNGPKNQQRDLNGLLIRMQEDPNQRQGNQRTISLSNGFVMNTVNRSNAESGMRRFLDTAKGINNLMGSQGPFFGEGSSKKKNYSVIPEEDSSMLGDLSFSQPTQNLLNQKLNSLNINTEANENQIPKETKLNFSYLPVDEELNAILEERIDHEKEPPGTYNRGERTDKILKYKNKIRKWRKEHPVNRNFKGRSVVAGKKPRIKGKFVKIEEYVEYIKTTNDNETGPQVNEHFNEGTTYAGSERSREHDLNVKEENF